MSHIFFNHQYCRHIVPSVLIRTSFYQNLEGVQISLKEHCQMFEFQNENTCGERDRLMECQGSSVQANKGTPKTFAKHDSRHVSEHKVNICLDCYIFQFSAMI